MQTFGEFDAVAAAWQRWFTPMQAAMRPVSDRLVALARIGPGARVLDIGTGLGDPALVAAEAIAPGGEAIGLDVAPAMIELARKRAREAGVSNVEFRVVAPDEEIPPGPYDAILSRWCLMFVPDPDRALAQYRSQLRHGARFAAATWARPADVPHISLPMAVAAQLGLVQASPVPPTGSPFSLNDPAQLERRLEDAGFVDARVEPFELTYRFSSPAEYYRYVSDVSQSVRSLQREIAEPAKARFQAAVEQEVASRFTAPDGTVSMPNRALIASGTNP